MVTAKLRNIIGGELLSIYQNYDPNNPSPEIDSFFVAHDGYVTIDIICKVDTGIVSSLLRTNTVSMGLLMFYRMVSANILLPVISRSSIY